METERPVDGRTARRDRNRLAVLDAVLELFAEDNLNPGVHEVADRSGVSLRSVYRYFEDLDELVTAAIERQVHRSRHLFEIEGLGEGPLDDRVHRFTERRMRLYEAIRTVHRACHVRAASDSRIRREVLATQRKLAEQTERMFAPELGSMDDAAADDAVRTVDVLTQFDSLEHLRHRWELDRDQAVAYLRRSIRRVLGAA